MLSRSSEYAIRALTHLASLNDGRHHLSRDLAEELGLPAPFLGKVLQPLVTRGVLHSQRGRSGGFRLAKPAASVTLIEIVDAQETLGPAETCLLGQRDCSDAAACPLHEYWKKASIAFHDRLRRTTLADLVKHAEAHPECSYPLPNGRQPAASMVVGMPTANVRSAI